MGITVNILKVSCYDLFSSGPLPFFSVFHDLTTCLQRPQTTYFEMFALETFLKKSITIILISSLVTSLELFWFHLIAYTVTLKSFYLKYACLTYYQEKRKLEDGYNLSTNLLLVSKWEAEFIDWEKIKGEKQIWKIFRKQIHSEHLLIKFLSLVFT